MACRQVSADTNTTTLRALVRDILANDYEPGSIVVDALEGKSPVSTMTKVALMLLAEMFGEDLEAWDVSQMTPALWATVQAKMGATGWRMIVASEAQIPGLTDCESAIIPDHYLWSLPGVEDRDIPGNDVPDWPVYHLAPAGVFLAVAPNAVHQ